MILLYLIRVLFSFSCRLIHFNLRPLSFCVIRAPEFILYKLKEMGKITQEDISMVMEEFEELDVDQSGTLSVSDISLAQSDPREKSN